jgi:predicted DNA-binding transcriptional regulator AlpA
MACRLDAERALQVQTTLQRQRAIMTTSVSNGRAMLTAEEVHDITGVPISTLHDWAAKRERGMQAPGPHHIRLSNRHRRWARKDVDEWIESARI